MCKFSYCTFATTLCVFVFFIEFTLIFIYFILVKKRTNAKSLFRIGEIKLSKCKFCNGTGTCYYCGGVKDLNKLEPSPLLFKVDKDKFVPCHVCGGTGKCPFCDGTGEYLF